MVSVLSQLRRKWNATTAGQFQRMQCESLGLDGGTVVAYPCGDGDLRAGISCGACNRQPVRPKIPVLADQIEDFHVWERHANANLRRAEAANFHVYDLVNIQTCNFRNFLIGQRGFRD